MRRVLVLAAAVATLACPAGSASAAAVRAADIVDTFSCEGKPYGYYPDVDNDYQVFHVCLPAQFPDGTEKTYKWSFICPQETQFSAVTYTCTRNEDWVLEMSAQ